MHRSLIAPLVLILAACSSSGGPESYRAPDLSVDGAETFRWAADDRPAARQEQAREVAAVVRREVIDALQQRGLKRVTGPADLVVQHELLVEMESVVVGGRAPGQQTSNAPEFNDGRDVDLPEDSTGGQDEERIEVPAGTLIITISNPQGRVLWRGWDSSAVDMLAIAQPELAPKVRAIMANFP